MSSAVQFLVLWFLGAASVANACVIDPRTSVLSNPDAAYSTYDAIFVGEIVGVAPIDSSWARVTFHVSERLKLDVADEVSLAVRTSTLCRPNTMLGARYVVFASDLTWEPPPGPLRPLPWKPSVPWDGDFILHAMFEVDRTNSDYLERAGSVLAELRALRANAEDE